jgi:hypothetical protein
MLDKAGVIAYVGAHAGQYGLDPAAVLAVADGEGLKTAPGSTWVVPGEPLPSFGPPSWYGGGAGAKILSMFGGDTRTAAAWAWSPPGLDYWLQSVKDAGAGNLAGANAIDAIVRNFERPAAQYVQGNITNAIGIYGQFQTWIADALQGIPIPIPVPGQPAPGPAPSPGNPVVPAPPTGSTQDVRLGTIGPFKVGIPSGLVLGLLGLSLLVIGVILFVAGGSVGIGNIGAKVRLGEVSVGR